MEAISNIDPNRGNNGEGDVKRYSLDDQLDKFKKTKGKNSYQNLLIIFGCTAELGVKAKSNLVKAFLAAIRENATNYAGKVYINEVKQLIADEATGKTRDVIDLTRQELVLEWIGELEKEEVKVESDAHGRIGDGFQVTD